MSFREFRLTKESWDSIDIDRVFQACDVAATADLAVLLITVPQALIDQACQCLDLGRIQPVVVSRESCHRHQGNCGNESTEKKRCSSCWIRESMGQLYAKGRYFMVKAMIGGFCRSTDALNRM